ncbi:apolipoprotein N-acyltransferase [Pseudoclavibacter chungangensis]|uniref:Apolipoprotein N-acyltransferase n=1 Tax=Pseudoclavibacter chungangensis TaxID=587635 RepID=A0A7J5C0C9_9MICO|nr:apolipoprotein N-acyltransferase [Pseudoclavibacter chungangensis]KAB1660174.1 apolipoprotein N-acyltransferase [Pseudoclavibacter chungangensis]NYJ66713.1 apolipoprotein N-acyltransferase [Pseudoclavibacter chungangensis]
MRRDPLRLPPLQALLAGVSGGIILSFAFPDRGWWPCAFLGVAFVLLALRGRSGPGALVVGFATGLAFYLPLISWASLFLGPVPYSALSVVESLFWAAGSLLITLAYRRLPGTVAGSGPVVAVAVAGLWTLREAIASTWPYGGFAWGRVAQSQSASPFAELVSWLGLSGLSFVIVLVVALLLEALAGAVAPPAVVPPRVVPADAVPSPVAARRAGASDRAVRALAAAAALAVLAAIPVFPTTQTGTFRVAAVQGDTPEAGYFAPGERGDVVRAHLETTSTIPSDAKVQAILWPEGSADVSPVYDRGVAFALTRLAERYGAPVVANTVTVVRGETEDDDRYYNTQFVWTADGEMADEASKQHPIPFGEYIPDRDFWYPLAPDLIGLVQRGYTPGDGPAVLDVDGTRIGSFICFDIVDDRVIRDAVEAGAGVLFTPTNNADFGDTPELAQQLAFARLRAMETGRAIVQVSTVGDSAVYAPDGTELAALERFEAGVMIVDLPVMSGITPAVAAGRAIEFLLAGAGVVLLLSTFGYGRRTPRTR